MASTYTMTPERWARELSGEGCPFCSPREPDNAYWLTVSKLKSSTLHLSRDQRFPGRCLLIWDGPHAVGLGSLSEGDAMSMLSDLLLANGAIERATGCALMNVASLGNQIAHLHFHLIPRSPGDPRWGAPPWTSSPDDIPEKAASEEELLRLRGAILAELGGG